tara:strand:+ start:374 stop:559 length:186 start_codon:yes stop_codon:yes gene_type:complete
MKQINNKPVIETLINTCALALTAYAVQQITISAELLRGSYILLLGMGLEWFKYWGRNKKYW